MMTMIVGDAGSYGNWPQTVVLIVVNIVCAAFTIGMTVQKTKDHEKRLDANDRQHEKIAEEQDRQWQSIGRTQTDLAELSGKVNGA